MLEMSGLVIHGNSGGPTFDTSGKLVGIISRSNISASTIYSTPVTAAEIDQLKSAGE